MIKPGFNSRSFFSNYAAGGSPLPENLLGRVEYGLGLPRPQDAREMVVSIDPGRPSRWAEQWISTLPVQFGYDDGFGYSHNGEVLFGSVFVPESDLGDLERATLKIYVRIEQLLQRWGYPYCLRVWNFLSDINIGEGDNERYRLFNSGRNRALALKPDFEQRLPAATAIGMLEPGLVIYFLAGKAPGLPIENPRQTAAYRYPRQYGPRSPSFARGSVIGAGAYSRLLLSGTASVVGHESLHIGDPVAQLEETRANIDSLIANAVKVGFPDSPSPVVRPELLKLYLRDLAHLEQLQPQLEQLRGAQSAPLLVLQGDVCREELLLEVEGVYVVDAAL